jgi:hypothetical protein
MLPSHAAGLGNRLTPHETWADLINVFEVFLPHLLAYPNPADPLYGEAAALMLRDPEKYKAKIREVLLPGLLHHSGHSACSALLAIRLVSPARDSSRISRSGISTPKAVPPRAAALDGSMSVREFV